LLTTARRFLCSFEVKRCFNRVLLPLPRKPGKRGSSLVLLGIVVVLLKRTKNQPVMTVTGIFVVVSDDSTFWLSSLVELWTIFSRWVLNFSGRSLCAFQLSNSELQLCSMVKPRMKHSWLCEFWLNHLEMWRICDNSPFISSTFLSSPSVDSHQLL
jgi:hypothetical protein